MSILLNMIIKENECKIYGIKPFLFSKYDEKNIQNVTKKNNCNFLKFNKEIGTTMQIMMICHKKYIIFRFL